jgi:uncharacterized membrane protein
MTIPAMLRAFLITVLATVSVLSETLIACAPVREPSARTGDSPAQITVRYGRQMTDGEQPGPNQNPPPDEPPDAGLTEHEPDRGAGQRHYPGRGGERANGSRTYALARAGFIEYDRVLFFSDAIFAIAITLLAVELRQPLAGISTGKAGLFEGGVGNSLLGFAISFAVIALFWLSHHGLFRYILALDRTLIVLNLLFLGTIAFLPYPTRVMADFGDRSSVVSFYAICVAAAGLAEGAMWVYATARPELVDASALPVRLFVALRIARIPFVFVLSIPVAVVAPRVAQYLWILIVVLGMVINRLVPPRPARRP